MSFSLTESKMSSERKSLMEDIIAATDSVLAAIPKGAEGRKNIPVEELARKLNLSKEEIDQYIAEVFRLYSKEMAEKIDETLESTLPNYSRYGFDIRIYKEYLPYAQLALLVEKNGTAEDHAYKLAVLFGEDKKTAFEFLKSYERQARSLMTAGRVGVAESAGEELQFMHDAINTFNLPTNEGWNIELWRALGRKHAMNGSFTRAFANATSIEENLEVRLEQSYDPARQEFDEEALMLKEMQDKIQSILKNLGPKDEEQRVALRTKETALKNKVKAQDAKLELDYKKFKETFEKNKRQALAGKAQGELTGKRAKLKVVQSEIKALTALIATEATQEHQQTLTRLKAEETKVLNDIKAIQTTQEKASAGIKSKIEEINKKVKESKKKVQALRALEQEIKSLAENKEDRELYEYLSQTITLLKERRTTMGELETCAENLEVLLKTKLSPVDRKNLEEYTLQIKQLKDKHRETIKKLKTIESECTLTERASPAKLFELVSEISYKRAKENKSAADLFLSYNEPEEYFEQYLNLKLKDPKEDTLIPDIRIEGKDYGFPGFYIRKLHPKDPRGALLGNITGCCQSIGHEGNDCVVHGLTSPYGGFYVLCKEKRGSATKKQSDENREQLETTDEILAQCWVWRSEKNNLSLDSIETQRVVRNTHANVIDKLFTALAFELVQKKHANRVMVGRGGTSQSFRTISTMHPKVDSPLTDQQEIPLVDKMNVYAGYRDSGAQSILADREYLALSLIRLELTEKLVEFMKQNPGMLANEPRYLMLAIQQNNLRLVKLILAEIAIISDKKRKGETINFNFHGKEGYPLVLAIGLGHFDIAKELIEAGAEINKSDDNSYQNNILSLALEKNDFGFVKYLINKGINIKNIQKFRVATGLSHPNIEIARYFYEILHQQKEIDEKEIIQEALIDACRKGNLEVVKFLLQKFENNLEVLNKKSLLPFSCESGNLDLVKYLLEKGANVQSVHYHDGGNALHAAAHSGNLLLIKFLVDQGLDINNKDFRGEFPIEKAFVPPKPLIIKYFIELGCDINHQSLQGFTVFYRMIDYTNDENVHKQMNDLIKFIVEQGKVDINKKNLDGSNALFAAVNNPELLEYLIEKGVDYRCVDNAGRNLLHHAAQRGSLETVQYLVQVLQFDFDIHHDKELADLNNEASDYLRAVAQEREVEEVLARAERAFLSDYTKQIRQRQMGKQPPSDTESASRPPRPQSP